MQTIILKALGIRNDEKSIVFQAMSYSFFLGLAIAFFYTCSVSLFVVNFPSSYLPYAYIAGGLVGYFLWLLYSHFEKTIIFSKLLIYGVIFLVVSVVILSVSYMITDNKWLAFVMFIWIRVFLFIAEVGFWGMITKIFTLQQGKRLFGLIGSGEVISSIISFFSIPFLIKLFNLNFLFYLTFIGLGFCILLMIIMVQNNKTILRLIIREKKVKEKNKSETKTKDRKNYIKYLFMMAILPMLGLIFIEYIFLDQTKTEFNNEELVASFLGIFFGAMAIGELLIKSLLSGRLLNRYGIRFGLSSLPIIVSLSVLCAAISGIFYGPQGMFFSFIVLSKLLEKILRSSLYDPSYQILYLPLPDKIRLSVKSQIEGVPKAIGSILAGAILILYTNLPFLNLVHFSLILLLIFLLWIRISRKMYNQYKTSIKKKLSGDKESISKIISTLEQNYYYLSEKIKDTSKSIKIFLLNVIHKIYPMYIEKELINALKDKKIQPEIFDFIADNHLISTIPALEEIKSDINDEFSNNLEQTLEHLYYEENLSIANLAEMVHSYKHKNRLDAAILLGYSGRYEAFKHLLTLLQEHDSHIKSFAIRSSGRLRRYELWEKIIYYLLNPLYINDSSYAIQVIGKPILSNLETFIENNTGNPLVQKRVIKLIGQIGGDEAIVILRKFLEYPAPYLRRAAEKSLELLNYTANYQETSLIKRTINEISNNLTWVLASIIDVRSGSMEQNFLLSSLENELDEKKNQIFTLLSLIYDAKTINYIKSNSMTASKEARMFAQEICELTLDVDIKPLILPLIQDLSLQERLNQFKQVFPQEKFSKRKRLFDIINKDYNVINFWSKACALDQLKSFSDSESISVLRSCIVNSEPLIRELSISTIWNLGKEFYYDTVKYFKPKEQKYFESIIAKLTSHDKFNNLLFNKIQYIKDCIYFNGVPIIDVFDLAKSSEIKKLNSEDFNEVNINSRNNYILLAGKVLFKNENTMIEIKTNELIGNLSLLKIQNPEGKYISEGLTWLLQINEELIYNLIYENVNIITNILNSRDFENASSTQNG